MKSVPVYQEYVPHFIFRSTSVDSMVRLALGAQRALQTIIPPLQDRIPITRRTAPYQVACYIPFIFMAYLARRPDTHIIRLLLLPTVLCGILASAYRFVWIAPELNVYNWGQCEQTLDTASTRDIQSGNMTRSFCWSRYCERVGVCMSQRRHA